MDTTTNLNNYQIIRYNTIFFDLKHVENSMDEADVQEFFQKIGVEFNDVVAMDLNPYRKRAMVKFQNKDVFKKFLAKNPNCHAPLMHQEKKYEIPMIINDGNTKILMISDLPVEAEDRFLIEILAPYGNVINIKRKEFNKKHSELPHTIVTQSLTVLINLKEDIPRYMTLGGQRFHVRYEGQKINCPICQSPDHIFTECPEHIPKQIEQQAPRWNRRNTNQNHHAKQPEDNKTVANRQETWREARGKTKLITIANAVAHKNKYDNLPLDENDFVEDQETTRENKKTKITRPIQPASPLPTQTLT